MVQRIIFTQPLLERMDSFGQFPSLEHKIDSLSAAVHGVVWRNYPDANRSQGAGFDHAVTQYRAKGTSVATVHSTRESVTVDIESTEGRGGVVYADVHYLEELLQSGSHDPSRTLVMFPHLDVQHGEHGGLPPHTQEWAVIINEGHCQGNRTTKMRQLTQRFGEGSWQSAHMVNGEIIPERCALVLYEEAYYHYFRNHPDVLEWLVKTASEVYDLDTSDVNSALDYAHQQHASPHYQDIAIRRVVNRLGKEFRGKRLIRVRSTSEDAAHLSPGRVPFHAPTIILDIPRGGWWNPGSIEEFYQRNAVLLVDPEAFMLKRVLTDGTTTYFQHDEQTFYRSSRQEPTHLCRVGPAEIQGVRGTGEYSEITETTAIQYAAVLAEARR